MPDQIVIPRRFNGPPSSGHGGYVAGVMAELLGGNSPEITLRRPPPLEVPLRIERENDGLRLCDGDGQLIADATPAVLELEVPDPPSAEGVARAHDASPRLRPGAGYPTCVACGPARAEGDGLRIFAGAVEGRDIVAASWVADASLAGDGGMIEPRYVWTAIDCPSYAALTPGREPPDALLGRICATLLLPVRGGEKTTIIGWRLGEDGRKRHSASALFSQAGELCAYGRMTWVVIE